MGAELISAESFFLEEVKSCIDSKTYWAGRNTQIYNNLSREDVLDRLGEASAERCFGKKKTPNFSEYTKTVPRYRNEPHPIYCIKKGKPTRG